MNRADADDGGMRYPDDVPTLTDGPVTLRAYSLDDLDECVVQCNDPECIAWTTIPVPYGRADAVSWVTREVPQAWADGSSQGFAIEAAHRDGVRRYAGGISLRPRADGVAEIGFAVHPAARGRGVGRRAIKLLVDWGFAERGVELVAWHAYVGNWPSRRAVWANGFSFDGTIAGFLVQRDQRRDAWVGTLRGTDDREPKTTWLDPPVLQSERLRLRPFTDADVGRLHEMLNDERSMHYGGRVQAARSRDGATALARIREQHAAGQIVNWCVADRHTDQALGKIQLFDLEGLDDSGVQTGYVIHPDVRGRGLLTEALRTLVEWTFRPVTLGGFGKRRVAIGTAASNAASRYAAERAGFSLVATIPSAFTVAEADFDDELIYHRINPSWQP
ncbi:MAG: GNAT family N-acetyltransferase [Labedaea sp.]